MTMTATRNDRIFSETEVRALLRAVRLRSKRGNLFDRSDYALVTFCWATGCRASEVASLSLDPGQPNHIDLSAGVVVIREAKWNSQGAIPLDVKSLRTLRWFAREVRPLIRNADSLDRLFLTRTGGIYSANVMVKKISRLLTRFGYPGKTCHSFRHHMATSLFKRGAKLHEVQAVLRHRDVRSTMIYSHTSVADLRAVLNRRAV